MKNFRNLLFIFLVMCYLGNVQVHALTKQEEDANNITDKQRAIQESAYAYYMHTANIHYNDPRRTYYTSPENFTSQNVGFFVCSGFTFAVYYDALNINLPLVTPNLLAAAYVEQNGVSTEEDGYFHDSVLDLNTLEIGDLLIYAPRNTDGSFASGHVGLVYDFIYDANGNRIDAYVMNSRGDSSDLSGSIKIDRYYKLNDDDLYFQSKMEKTSLTRAILRPLNNIENDISLSASSRIEYPKIYVQKTVDVGNNSTVSKNDTLIYTLIVKNNSSIDYHNMAIVEELSPYVILDENNPENTIDIATIDDNQRTLTWNVSGIKAGEELLLKYAVKVNTSDNVLIESNGKVDNIPSSTIKNEVGFNLHDISFENAYEIFKNNYTGKELINEIYNDTLGIDLHLDDLKVAAFRAKSTINSCWNKDYYKIQSASNNGLVIFNSLRLAAASGGTRIPGELVSINDSNSLANAVLGGYYNAIFKFTDCRVRLKNFEGRLNTDYDIDKENNFYSLPIYRYIDDNNFQNGDILLYVNHSDEEAGEYALIYINGKFYSDNTVIEDDNYQSLFDKEVYVILRPSLMFDKVDISDNLLIDIDQRYIRNIASGMSYSQLFSNIDTKGMFSFATDGNDMVKTGDSLITYKLIVNGDVNGDGNITITDLVKVKKHIVNAELLDGIYEVAGDVTDTGEISTTDLIKIARGVARIEAIS